MRAAHRHTSGTGHEHEFEPQLGLPEMLPADEKVLWQGQPDWRMLARKAFHVRKLVVYFGALMLLRLVFQAMDGEPVATALKSISVLAAMSVLAIGLVMLMAWLSARGALYTITNKRVVMRVGIVLTLTFNLPHKRIASAGLHRYADGTGDLPLTLLGSDRIAWLNLWPHARPWKISRPQPMLRCVPDAAAVAELLASAWSQATGRAANAGQSGAVAQQGSAAGAGQPQQAALAGR
jgi:hypothetical protein